MGLLDQAVADARAFTTDVVTGFGKSVLVANPDGEGAELAGTWNDVDVTIDPDTGAPVKGRTVSVTFSIDELIANGFDALVSGVSDAAGKPWTVNVRDQQGNDEFYKVSESRPDRTLGLVVCMLEYHRLQPAG